MALMLAVFHLLEQSGSLTAGVQRMSGPLQMVSCLGCGLISWPERVVPRVLLTIYNPPLQYLHL